MITIKVSKGVPYIWDPEDWLKLRQEHRILGALDGAIINELKGRMRWNVPMRLTDVEVQYLTAQGIAKTVHAPSLHQENVVPIEDLENIKEQKKHKHLEMYKKFRKEEIEMHYDKIVEGKRKKGKIIDFDKDVFIKNELDKIEKSPFEMYQVEFSDPLLNDQDYLPYDFPAPQSYVEKLRLKVFEDFHLSKKYWISPGIKFGGDYLAYPGDPRHFHSEFIILCPDKGLQLDHDHVRTQCRISVTVKKTFLIASLDEDSNKLKYYVPKRKIL